MPTYIGVVVHLLKRRPRQPKGVQHPLVLRAVLSHHLSKLVVHIRANTHRGVFFLFGNLTDNLGLNRAGRRKRLTHGFSLEAYRCLSKHSGVHPAGALPRLSALIILEPEHLKALDECVGPVFTAGDIGFHAAQQIFCYLVKLALVQILR